MIRPLAPDEAPGFAPLTFPRYRGALGRLAEAPSLVALGARDDAGPVALALAERAGIDIDPSIRPEVVVLEETANRRYIVLPYTVSAEEDVELSDADLAMVAGGSASGEAQCRESNSGSGRPNVQCTC